jgi:hypothetical protein
VSSGVRVELYFDDMDFGSSCVSTDVDFRSSCVSTDVDFGSSCVLTDVDFGSSGYRFGGRVK